VPFKDSLQYGHLTVSKLSIFAPIFIWKDYHRRFSFLNHNSKKPFTRLPMSNSERWEDLMSPAEINLHNTDPENYAKNSKRLDKRIKSSEHPYANFHEDPLGREDEVQFDGDMHTPSSPDTDRHKYLLACLEFTDGCSELEVKCHLCGLRLLSRSRRFSVAVWDNDEDTDELASKLIVYCIGCLELPHTANADKLTPLQRRIRELIGEGWSQTRIADELEINQGTVSRLWKLPSCDYAQQRRGFWTVYA
jgi:predicted XRE-type DNA-binding protein